MGRYKSAYIAVFDYDEAAFRGVEQLLVDKMLQIHPAFHGGTIAGHYVGHSNARQRMGEADLQVALARGMQEKPANECDPQAADSRSAKILQDAQHDENETDGLTGARGQLRRAIAITCFPPDDCPEYPAAVERVAGYQIERGEHEVDVAPPVQHRHPGIRRGLSR